MIMVAFRYILNEIEMRKDKQNKLTDEFKKMQIER